jgi:Protein of unknown function (DUF2975)
MDKRGRRGGWLGAIRVVLAIAMFGDLLYLATLPWHGTFRVAMVGLTGFTDPYGHDLPRGNDLMMGDTEVGLRHYTTGENLLYLAGHGLTLALVALPLIWLAQRLIRDAIDGDPFVPGMARRLRVLGFAVLGAGILTTVVQYVTSHVLVRLTMPDYLVQPYPIDDLDTGAFWWVLVAFMVLAFAGILRRGVALRAELDEVI